MGACPSAPGGSRSCTGCSGDLAGSAPIPPSSPQTLVSVAGLELEAVLAEHRWKIHQRLGLAGARERQGLLSSLCKGKQGAKQALREEIRCHGSTDTSLSPVIRL